MKKTKTAQNGKGSRFRKVDKDQYDRNYEEIFKKKKGVKK